MLGDGGKIGAFVETKNAQIGDGAKVPHLSYVGDAEIGEGTNIGAGTIFANYDGVAKHRTTVGRHARRRLQQHVRGAGEIGDGAATGGGTVVRRDVPPGRARGLRGPQRNIEGWVPPAARDRRGGGGTGGTGGACVVSDGPESRRTTLGQSNVTTSERGASGVSGMKRTTEKNLMVFSGRAHPELAEEVAEQLGTGLVPTSAYEFANSEIYVRFEESVRGCDAFVIQSHTGADQRVDHGAPDHGRRAQAGVGQADHRGHAVLRLRPPGQEAPRPRADLRAADGRPVQDRRRRPADRRSTCTPRRSRASSTARSTT